MRRLPPPSPECVGKISAIVIITAIALSPLPATLVVAFNALIALIVEYLMDSRNQH